MDKFSHDMTRANYVKKIIHAPAGLAKIRHSRYAGIKKRSGRYGYEKILAVSFAAGAADSGG